MRGNFLWKCQVWPKVHRIFCSRLATMIEEGAQPVFVMAGTMTESDLRSNRRMHGAMLNSPPKYMQGQELIDQLLHNNGILFGFVGTEKSASSDRFFRADAVIKSQILRMTDDQCADMNTIRYIGSPINFESLAFARNSSWAEVIGFHAAERFNFIQNIVDQLTEQLSVNCAAHFQERGEESAMQYNAIGLRKYNGLLLIVAILWKTVVKSISR